jgi:prolyl-tRNA editing enzyme YbaK/EbsC (Cys-tRNA(Pro) deacylase)
MSFESVKKLLTDNGVRYRLIELSKPAFSVRDVIEFSKDPIEHKEICKTIIVKDECGKFYATLLKGNDLIDFKKLDKIIGLKTKIASPYEVNEVTGQTLGSLCPIILKIPIFIDHQVLDLRKINFGSGNLSYGIEISVKDLVRITEFKIVDISKDQIRKGNK